MDWVGRLLSVALLLLILGLVFFSAHDPYYWWLEFQRLVEGDEQLLLILVLTLVGGVIVSNVATVINDKEKGLGYSWVPFVVVFLLLYLMSEP